MTQKFYLHDAVSTVAGTLPGSTTQSTAVSSPNVTATGAGTNRTMDGTIGSAQASAALTTLAQTTQQQNWLRRFITPALAAQTLPSGTYSYRMGYSQSNTNSQFALNTVCVYVWRPSTGARVAYISDIAGPAAGAAAGLTETDSGVTGMFVAAAGTVIQDGDVIVWEIFSRQSQTSAMAYTNTIFYDGNAEGSIISNAAYLLAPANIPLYVPSTAPPQKAHLVPQAVSQASNW